MTLLLDKNLTVNSLRYIENNNIRNRETAYLTMKLTYLKSKKTRKPKVVRQKFRYSNSTNKDSFQSKKRSVSRSANGFAWKNLLTLDVFLSFLVLIVIFLAGLFFAQGLINGTASNVSAGEASEIQIYSISNPSNSSNISSNDNFVEISTSEFLDSDTTEQTESNNQDSATISPAENLDSLSQVADIHIVKPGDTLYGLSLKYSISLADLADLNNLIAPYTLSVGEEIKLK